MVGTPETESKLGQPTVPGIPAGNAANGSPGADAGVGTAPTKGPTASGGGGFGAWAQKHKMPLIVGGAVVALGAIGAGVGVAVSKNKASGGGAGGGGSSGLSFGGQLPGSEEQPKAGGDFDAPPSEGGGGNAEEEVDPSEALITGTFSSPFSQDGSVVAVFAVDWEGATSGCHDVEPGVAVSCPVGAVLLSPKLEDGRDGRGCSLVGETTIACASDLDEPIYVGCYGDSADELGVTVTVGEGQYYCDELDDFVIVDPPTVFYVGTASHVALLGNKCGGSWQNVRDVACTPSSAAESTVTDDGVTLGFCRRTEECSEGFGCVTGVVFGCFGQEWCANTVGDLSLTPRTPQALCTEGFTRSIPAGQACDYNAMCATGICVADACRDERLEDGSAVCREDADCRSGACARPRYDPSDPTTACCPGGERRVRHAGAEYCTGQPDGAGCALNEMCGSGICVFGTCLAERLPDREACEEDADCSNFKCSDYDNGQLACCPDGGSIAVDDKVYCVDRPEGAECWDNTACESNICIFDTCREERLADLSACEESLDCMNGACAKSEHDEFAPLVCCESGIAYLQEVSWSYSDAWVCGNLKLGDRCSGNLACDSNICLFGVCVEERVTDLQPCEYDSHCLTGSCAKKEHDEFADLVCCAEGEAYLQEVSWTYSDQMICSNLQVGDKCSSNLACISKICLGGMCVSERVADLEPCEFDSHCISGKCALQEYDEFAAKVCCAEGAVDLYDVSWTYSDQFVCHNLQLGQKCASSLACESNLCLGGVCAPERVADLQPCEFDSSCITGKCALKEHDEFADKVCCTNGGAYLQEVSWSYSDAWVCNNLQLGEKCSGNLACESGICLLGVCQANRLSDLEPCEEDSHCLSGRCALQEQDEFAERVCCRNGAAFLQEVSWTYSDQMICGNLQVGDKCSSNLSCESNICLNGVCVSERVADLEPCEVDSHCLSGSCAKNEMAENAPLVCCPGGDVAQRDVSWTWRDEMFCADAGISELPSGQPCSSNNDCASHVCLFGVCSERVPDLQPCEQANDCLNRVACAKSTFAENSPTVCCGGGLAFYLERSWSYGSEWFCANLALGSVCGDDRTCDSGICVAGICQSERLADGEACQEPSDCSNRVACAKSSYEENAPNICCRDGEAYKLDVGWDYKDYWFCGNRPLGTSCGDNRVCESGICVAGTCRSERLADGEACQEPGDCLNRVACAKSEFRENAPNICCEDGDAYKLDVSYDYKDYWFCANLPLNATCGDDRLCASGICIEGTCRSERLADEEACQEQSDCSNRVACAKSSYKENAPNICCRDGEAYKLDVGWDYKDYWFCGNRPLGTSCGDNRVCESGICVAGTCQSERLADGEACQEPGDCLNRVACAKSEFRENAPNICCDDGDAYKLDVSYDYKDNWFCGNLALGKACGDDRLCASGICIEGTCRSDRLVDGQSCQANFDCINGACAKASFIENSPFVCCRDGESHLVDVPWDWSDERICGNLEPEVACGTDLMCKAKECLSGSCS